jgi:hypothetical protein
MLLNLCNEFLCEVQDQVYGARKPPRFFQDLNSEYHQLARELSDTMPNFEITPREDDQDDSDSHSSMTSKHGNRRVSKKRSTKGRSAHTEIF